MQQQSSKCFASIPLPPDPWVNRSNFPFQNIIMLHIKLNGIRICSNMIANILLADPPPPPNPRGQNSTFSKHGHVAYQIKSNRECSNMVANILRAQTPTLGIFHNMILLLIMTTACVLKCILHQLLLRLQQHHLLVQPR